MITHLHRDVGSRGYFSGVWNALKGRSSLVHGLAKYFDSSGSFRYGWHDFDPHTLDVAVDGMPIARIESHHDREYLDVFLEHPQAAKFLDEAQKRGGYRKAY